MQNKISVLVIVFILIAEFTNAQQAGINFSIASPQGDFGKQVDNFGYGLSGEIMFLSPKPQSPFGIGLNLGYFVYGMESRREPWSHTIPDVYLNVDRTNNLLNFHLVFELGLPAGIIRPYIQGLFGANYLYTETSVRGDYGGDDIASTTNFDDWAWSYGAGGGVAILLSGDPVTETGAIYLDLKGRYLFGSKADYLKEGSIQIINSRVVYNPSQSKTDILTLHLGVRIAFNFQG